MMRTRPFPWRSKCRSVRPVDSPDRSAVAMVEVVLAATVGLIISGLLVHFGVIACRNLHHVIANLVGWPYL